jgi:hypothetical protein
MLTGQRAFSADDPYSLLRKQVEHPPPRPRDLAPDLPEQTERAILRALSKQPDARFASCQEFVRKLGHERAESPPRHMVPTRAEDRISFYIAHVAEESLLARPIGEDSSEISHPFLDLYLAGLLGVLQPDFETGMSDQRFRRPHDALTHSATDLPDSPVFLIHPALDTLIRGLRARSPFLQCQHAVVGDNLTWEPYFPTIVQIEKRLQKINDLHFVDLAHRVVKRAQAFLASGKVPFARVEIETGKDWKTLRSMENVDACCEVMLWLEQLLMKL